MRFFELTQKLKMPSLIRLIYHTGTITLAVILAFIWLRSPSLTQYSVQLFGSVILIYFIIKKLNQADFWQLLPSPASLEMALATLAFLILIGATGNVKSPLFPLSFVHLFFLTLSAQNITTLIILFEIILFHFSLSSGITTIEISYLVSLPIVTAFFLLAKDQFVKVFKQKTSATQVVNVTKTVEAIKELQRVDKTLENILAGLISHKTIESSQVTELSLDSSKLSESTSLSDIVEEIESAESSLIFPSEPVVDLSELKTQDYESKLVSTSPQISLSQNQPPTLTTELAASEQIADEILHQINQKPS